jgi:ferredoxin-nitrite reductase
LGKFGKIPTLCRNCKGAISLTSQNADRSVVRSLLALHKNRNLVFISPSPNSLDSIPCPGLFYPTAAQDGILARIRTPGGWLRSQQIDTIATVAASIGLKSLQVTNRANLQLKLATALTPAIFQQLQAVGIAGAIAEVDHLRNIMASPTAGLDTQALFDTRPIVQELDRYISNNPELVGLSPKFSIGIDGGESLSIRPCPNDVMLVAEGQGLRLFCNMGNGLELDTGLVCQVDDSVALVQTICQIYLDNAAAVTIEANPYRRSRQPRLRQLIAHGGLDWWVEQLTRSFPGHLSIGQRRKPSSGFNPGQEGAHLGPQQQRQAGYSYLGLVLPLGQLSIAQLRGLGKLATQYGSGSLRLTPWQNAILPDVLDTDLPQLLLELPRYGLQADPSQPAGSIAACRGKLGCQAAATHSQEHARALMQQLSDGLDRPLCIHVSGCAKGCAHPYGSDIALLGVTDGQTEGYEIYLRSSNQIFGQLIYPFMPVAQAIETVERMIRVYQRERRSAQESWPDFIDRYALTDLHQLFNSQS